MNISLLITFFGECANGYEEVEYSQFIGIRGIEFSDSSVYSSENIDLRVFDSVDNPNPNAMRTLSTKIDDNGAISVIGAIAEIRYKVKRVNTDVEDAHIIISENWEKSIKEVDIFRLSVALEKEIVQGFSTSFFESGFPLLSVGNMSYNNKYGSSIQVSKQDIKGINFWMQKLQKSDAKYLRKDFYQQYLVRQMMRIRRLKSSIVHAVKASNIGYTFKHFKCQETGYTSTFIILFS